MFYRMFEYRINLSHKVTISSLINLNQISLMLTFLILKNFGYIIKLMTDYRKIIELEIFYH